MALDADVVDFAGFVNLGRVTANSAASRGGLRICCG
jgi:hypothetical protein